MMVVKMISVFFCTIAFAGVTVAETLPVGVGVIALGGRQYVGDPAYYDQSGQSSPVGARFNLDFSAACMSSGKCGMDLKKLYDNVKKFDASNAGASQSMADQLTLGSQRGTVKSELSIKVLGIGFGLFNRVTVFASVPIINSSVDADIDFLGDNNASAIKNKLGDAAFDELKSGLDQASHLSKASILAKITDDYKYNSISHWEYKGIGDVAVGARTAWAFQRKAAPKYTLALSSQINFPTGPQYDPDSLTQMPLSRGCTSVDVITDHRLTWKHSALGSELGGGLGLPHDAVRRVPVGDEELVASERKANVYLQPGMDTRGSLYGIIGNSMYRGQYKLGVADHHADTFSGSLPGNYQGLGQRTETKETYHEATFIISTARAYKQSKASIPYVLSLSARNSLAGSNITSGPSFDLSFMTFFSTPMHKSAKI